MRVRRYAWSIIVLIMMANKYSNKITTTTSKTKLFHRELKMVRVSEVPPFIAPLFFASSPVMLSEPCVLVGGYIHSTIRGIVLSGSLGSTEPGGVKSPFRLIKRKMISFVRIM
jgi:hypothetical protein